MKSLERLIMNDEAQILMEKIRNINLTIEAKSYTIEEEEYHKKQVKNYLKRLNEIMKEE